MMLPTAEHSDTDTTARERKRYIKYSQKALQFEMVFVMYMGSASSSAAGNTTLVVLSVVALFIAICVDLFLFRLKPKWGRASVYLSSVSLAFMTLFTHLSSKTYNNGYAAIVVFVPLASFAIVLFVFERYAIFVVDWLRPHRTDKELNNMFNLAALVLSWGSAINMLMTKTPFIGLFFLLTVLVAIYMMVLTTVRTDGLTLLRAKLVDLLLRFLVLSTGVVTCMKFFTLLRGNLATLF